MELDRTVIILIGAGVCCAVIGLALFIKLLTVKPDYDEANVGKKKLLDEEYTDNFEECFDNTGNIEETLDQLANVYTGNQFMYNLIVDAIDYLNDGEGDYETALEKINVDSDINIMKMHNAAIRKALNIESKTNVKKDEVKSTPKSSKKKQSGNKEISAEYSNGTDEKKEEEKVVISDQEEYFDEDEDNDDKNNEDTMSEIDIPKQQNKDEDDNEIDPFGDDDLEDFKI